MKVLNFFKNLSIKTQMITGLGAVYLTLMLIISFSILHKQFEIVEEHLYEESEVMSKALAMSLGTNVLSRDLVGISEVMKNVSDYEDTKYVFVMDTEGKVLAHSNQAFVGKFIADTESQKVLTGMSEVVLRDDSSVLDRATPIIVNNKLVGWVRLGMDKKSSLVNAKKETLKVLSYLVLSMVIGFLLTYLIASRISRQLDEIMYVASKVESGDNSVRAKVYSKNEIGKLSLVFNSMLDSLKKEQFELLKSQVRLKKSEERLDLAMQGSRDGIWDWDLRTGEMYYSPRWLEIIGLTPSDLVPGKSEWSKRIHPDDFKVAEIALNNHLKGNTLNYECEQRLLHKNGEYVWTIGRGVGIKDESGKVIRIVGTQTDISVQKTAEIEKEKIFNQLRQSQKMEAIGQLTGGIAHDFNNILAGIIGFTELGIKRSSKDEKIVGYFYHVSKLAARARDLIRQMLIYSRGGDPIPKVIHPDVVITESLHLLKPIIANELKVNFKPEDFKSLIKIDPVQLQQVVMNLAINARDAMEGKVGLLDITLHESEKTSFLCSSCGTHVDDDFVMLSIKDNASGMKPETVKKIFEPFFTTKAPGKGTGMGLSMVHGIVHRHGGHLVVESVENEGTTFKIYFPKAVEEIETKVLTQVKNIKSEVRSRILVVDDEEFMRNFVTDFLSDAGHECFEAENGKMALEMIEKDVQGFDLVITDYTMPEMTGIELIEKLRLNYPNILIILSSGNIDVALEKDYKHLKIDAVLVKPYDLDDAMVVINNLLRSVQKIAA